eukprot:CAMPEP_0184706972 /NCGR_PEP_ID=MMETSP0313-20130426/37033_1 /TAXON_ID=2792 /ORGANISM="Porphyridium aerugineum, Strain SAG 1380-2" /LENGTH=1389 /DNA_ID=CAMNT_0027168541 /DNA_START=521 /DNA_END=4690 /DNA_ORIENTATION=+
MEGGNRPEDNVPIHPTATVEPEDDESEGMEYDLPNHPKNQIQQIHSQTQAQTQEQNQTNPPKRFGSPRDTGVDDPTESQGNENENENEASVNKDVENDNDEENVVSTAKYDSVDAVASAMATDLRENTLTFTYAVENYPNIHEKRIVSPWNELGGYKWRMLIFPKGNQTQVHMSVYVECGGPLNPNAIVGDATASPPAEAWHRAASFKLWLVSQAEEEATQQMIAASTEIGKEPRTTSTEQEEQLIKLPSSDFANRNVLMKESQHRFSDKESDWGFREFVKLQLIARQEEGYLVNNGVKIVAMVNLIDDSALESPFSVSHYDSRKETGYVGLKNQGATCYMNSLLQTLYGLGAFRKSVYQMPLPEETTNGVDMTSSTEGMSYALQKVFYELQYSPTVVKTKKLTESFGWDNSDAFTQHDVQELNRILCDHLEEKMKRQNPHEQNTISKLFEGKVLNYIECVNVPYKSEREESFYDLSLNVKGCRNIVESFEKYTEVEMMDGDNKYRADGYEELQDARKGVKFVKLPPVLQLHLKRFEYDFMRDMMVKINDRFEFQTEIDLSRFVDKSDGSDTYLLHSVLVHIGDVHGGHYYVFIRPECHKKNSSGTWLKFDDEMVSRVKEDQAVEDNFGSGGEKKIAVSGDDYNANNGFTGNQTPPYQTRMRAIQARRFSNAYMLQYIRKDQCAEILSEVKPMDIPAELVQRIKKERDEEELRKLERAQQHLYMHVSVAFEDDLKQHTDRDLVSWDKITKIRVKRSMTLRELKEMIARTRKCNPECLRVWKFAPRQNDTIRPEGLLVNGEDDAPISEADTEGVMYPNYQLARYQEDAMKLYAEEVSENGIRSRFESLRQRLIPGDHPEFTVSEILKPIPGEILLFFKLYTPLPVPKLEYVTHTLLDGRSKIGELVAPLKHLAKIDANESITLYEEVRPDMTEKLDLTKAFVDSDMGEGGDIIVFQRSIVPPPATVSGVIPAIAATSPSASPPTEPMNGTKSDDEDMELEDSNDRSDASDDSVLIDVLQPERENPDLPLGGRLLLTAPQYFRYLRYRVLVEFRKREAPDETGFILELLRVDDYKEVRRRIGRVIDKNPDFIRIYPPDLVREAPRVEAVKEGSSLDKMLQYSTYGTPHIPSERRVLWYEITEFAIWEFEDKEEVRVVWRPDSGVSGAKLPLMEQFNIPDDPAAPWATTRLFSVLIPFNSKYQVVVDQVIRRLGLPVGYPVRLLEITNCTINRQIMVNEAVKPLAVMHARNDDDGSFELRAEPFPTLENGCLFLRVVHLAKEHTAKEKARTRRTANNNSFFGTPFIIQVFRDGEKVGELRQRLGRMFEGEKDFDQWALYEWKGNELEPLDDVEAIWRPTDPAASLVLEHKNTAPSTQRKATNFYSKPLKIKS